MQSDKNEFGIYFEPALNGCVLGFPGKSRKTVNMPAWI